MQGYNEFEASQRDRYDEDEMRRGGERRYRDEYDRDRYMGRGDEFGYMNMQFYPYWWPMQMNYPFMYYPFMYYPMYLSDNKGENSTSQFGRFRPFRRFDFDDFFPRRFDFDDFFFFPRRFDFDDFFFPFRWF